MKVIFYGDIQCNYKYPEYMDYLEETMQYLVDLIRDRDVSLAVNLGDTTDTNGLIDLESMIFAYNWMRKVGEAAGQQIILSGNHDISDKDGTISSIELLQDSRTLCVHLPELIQTVAGEIPCFPYTRDYVHVQELLDHCSDSDTHPAFMAGHLDWKGLNVTPTFVSTTGLEPEEYQKNHAGTKFFNGHYHNPVQIGDVRFVGSPLFKDFGDSVMPDMRGFEILDTETNEVERIPNPHTYMMDTIKMDKEADLVSWFEGRLSPEAVKVRVYTPKELVSVAERYRDKFMWMGVYPTDERTSIDHTVSVSLGATPTDVISEVVASAPETYNKKYLTELGEEIFS